MTYDQGKQSWKGSTDHALVCQVGNCNDIHALNLSLCRSVGIPARPAPADPGNQELPEGRVRCIARRTSATLHAWAMHPRGVNGGSPSAISQMLPRP